MSIFFKAILSDRPIRRLAPYVYTVLIVGLFFHPHFSAHIGPEWKPYIEGLANLIIVGIGILTFYIYMREQREFEHRFLETSTYIGAMNRKLPLLQNITTDLLSNGFTTAKQKNGAFEALLSLACSTVAQSHRGLLRFVEVGTGRTVKEFQYSLEDQRPDSAVTIGNKELLLCDSSSTRVTRTALHLVIAATDRGTSIRAFLVIPDARKETAEHISILRSIVDQGQLFLEYVFRDLSKSYA